MVEPARKLSIVEVAQTTLELAGRGIGVPTPPPQLSTAGPHTEPPVADLESFSVPHVGFVGSLVGSVAELRATVRLLELGHKVAVPVVDDDGVDLVVDYRWRVQVKSASLKGRLDRCAGYEFKMRGKRNRASGADFFLLYGRETDEWWVVPASAASGRRHFRVATGPAGSRGPLRSRDAFLGAWHLLAGPSS